MFCRNCGKQLEDGFKVCPYCGEPVSLAESDARRAAQEQTAAEDEEVLAFQPLELHVPADPLVDFQVHSPLFYRKNERRMVAATIKKMQAPNQEAAVLEVSGSPEENFW